MSPELISLVLQIVLALGTGAIVLLTVNWNTTRRLDKRLALEEAKNIALHKAHKAEIEELKEDHDMTLAFKDGQIREALELAKGEREKSEIMYATLEEERTKWDSERRSLISEHDEERREMRRAVSDISRKLIKVANYAKQTNAKARTLERDLKEEKIYRGRIEEQRDKANQLLADERIAKEKAEESLAQARETHETALKKVEDNYKGIIERLEGEIETGAQEREMLQTQLGEATKERNKLIKRIEQLEEHDEANTGTTHDDTDGGDVLVTHSDDGAGGGGDGGSNGSQSNDK